ncbi:hypothetical protein bcgnr5380_58260 [Bacillus cereus]
MSSLPPTRDLLSMLKEADRATPIFQYSLFTRVVEKTAMLVVCLSGLALFACVGLVVLDWVSKEALRPFVLGTYVLLLVVFIAWCGTVAIEGLAKVWKVARRFTVIQSDLIDSGEAVALQFQAYIHSASADDVEERKARVEQHLKDAKARGALGGAIVAAMTSLGGFKDFVSSPTSTTPFDLGTMAAALGLGIAVSLLFWLYAEVEFGQLAFELDRAAVAKRRKLAELAKAAPVVSQTPVPGALPAVTATGVAANPTSVAPRSPLPVVTQAPPPGARKRKKKHPK